MQETRCFNLDQANVLQCILHEHEEFVKIAGKEPKLLEICPVDFKFVYDAMFGQTLPFFHVHKEQSLEAGTARFLARVQ